MKYVKMLGLAAIAATALMAFVGASTASATVLCKTTGTNQAGQPTGTTCPANQAYPAGTEIHAVNVGRIVLDGEIFNIECEESTFNAKTANEGSSTETIKLNVEALTYKNCGASTLTTLESGTLELHWLEGTHNGTLTASGMRITSTTNTIFGPIHCEFVVQSQDLGVLTDSATPTSGAIFHSNARTSNLPTNALCPEEGAWTATYEITSPKPLSVAGHT